MAAQAVSQTGRFRRVAEELFLLFFLFVLRLQAPANLAGTKWRCLQLFVSTRFIRFGSNQRRSLGNPLRARRPLFAGRFRVAAHGPNRNRAAGRPAPAHLCAAVLSPAVPFWEPEPLVRKTLARLSSSCNYHLLPFGWAKRELSVEPKRGFGLMFLSAVEFHALHGFQGSALTRLHESVIANSWAFFLCAKLRAEPQPLFPGDVETSSKPLLLRVELGTSAKQGLFQASQVKGVGRERERYSQVV